MAASGLPTGERAQIRRNRGSSAALWRSLGRSASCLLLPEKLGENPRVAVHFRHRLSLPRFSCVEELKKRSASTCGENVSDLLRRLLMGSTLGRACGSEFLPSSS